MAIKNSENDIKEIEAITERIKIRLEGLKLSIDITSNVFSRLFNTAEKSLSKVDEEVTKIVESMTELSKTSDKTAIKMADTFNSSYTATINSMNIALKVGNAYKATENALKVANETITNRQIIAETALKAIKTPFFIGLVVGAVAAVTVGFAEWANSVDNTTNQLRREREEVEANNAALIKRKEAANASFEQSLADIAVLEKHANYIERNTSETGLFVGSQEKLQVALKNLNESFPDLILKYDEHSGKIVDQNGNVLELETSIRKLIEAKKIEAYLDANKDNYIQSVKEQIDGEKKQMDNIEQLHEMKQKRMKLDEEAYKSAWKLQEFDKAKQMILDAGYESDIEYGLSISRQAELEKNIESQKQLLNVHNDLIKSYENIDTLNQKGDIEGALSLIEGFGGLKVYDASKGKEQLEELKVQVEDAQKSLDSLELSGNNAFDEETYEQKLEQYKKNLENAQAEYQNAQDLYNQESIEKEETAAINRADQEVEIMKTKNEKITDDTINSASEATKKAVDAVNNLVNTAVISPIIIPVLYQENNRVQGLGRKGATLNAYDGDTSVFPAFTTDTFNVGKKSVVSLYSHLGATIGSNATKSNTNSVANNNFSQTNVFNVPVSKPSQQTKAIEQASRDLLKVR